MKGIGVTTWDESNRGRGPCLDGDKFRLFIKAAIVPELRAIGEWKLTQLRHWADLVGSVITRL